MFLSIVIPAYNEGGRIGATLKRYLKHFDPQKTEFLVILNGCTDNTFGVVEEFRKRFSNLIILDIPEAVGKGAAIRKGFSLASGENIGFVDADGATDPKEFDTLVAALKDTDGVIASRWKKGSRVINRKFFRKVISLLFLSLVRAIVWLPFVDTQCGAKVFKRRVIRDVLPNLTVNNMAFDVDLLHQCKLRRYRIIEQPTVWTDQDSSGFLGSPWKVIKSGLIMLFTLVKIRLSNNNYAR